MGGQEGLATDESSLHGKARPRRLGNYWATKNGMGRRKQDEHHTHLTLNRTHIREAVDALGNSTCRRYDTRRESMTSAQHTTQVQPTTPQSQTSVVHTTRTIFACAISPGEIGISFV